MRLLQYRRLFSPLSRPPITSRRALVAPPHPEDVGGPEGVGREDVGGPDRVGRLENVGRPEDVGRPELSFKRSMNRLDADRVGRPENVGRPELSFKRSMNRLDADRVGRPENVGRPELSFKRSMKRLDADSVALSLNRFWNSMFGQDYLDAEDSLGKKQKPPEDVDRSELSFKKRWNRLHGPDDRKAEDYFGEKQKPRGRLRRPIWLPPLLKPPVTSRRAVVLQRFGGPKTLKLRNVEVPGVRKYQVLVRVRAASINTIDSATHYGFNVTARQYGIPYISGHDVSGEVAAVGASIKHLAVGQEVYGASIGYTTEGSFADYVIMEENQLIGKPKSITHEEASAIPFAALTAWAALKRIAEISEGQRVLVIGGDEAVGFAAIQLAVMNRCQVVAICRSENIDQVLAAGVEHAIDYTAEDIKLVIKGEFDVVLDTLGASEIEKIGTSVLKRSGR